MSVKHTAYPQTAYFLVFQGHRELSWEQGKGQGK